MYYLSSWQGIGIAVASTRIIKQVEEYVHKLQIIFVPLFFVIIGAQVDLRGINLDVLLIAGILVLIATVRKLLGSGLPSLIFLKDKSKAMRVGIGMIFRGEVGLIVAGRCNIRCIYEMYILQLLLWSQ